MVGDPIDVRHSKLKFYDSGYYSHGGNNGNITIRMTPVPYKMSLIVPIDFYQDNGEAIGKFTKAGTIKNIILVNEKSNDSYGEIICQINKLKLNEPVFPTMDQIRAYRQSLMIPPYTKEIEIQYVGTAISAALVGYFNNYDYYQIVLQKNFYGEVFRDFVDFAII